MANELSISGSLRFTKGDVDISLSKSAKLTITGTKYTRLVQSIGITEEAIDLGDLAGVAGYLIAINNDPTNFVSIRSGTGAANLVKVRAGKFAIFELASAAPFAIADTAICNVEFLIIEQ